MSVKQRQCRYAGQSGTCREYVKYGQDSRQHGTLCGSAECKRLYERDKKRDQRECERQLRTVTPWGTFRTPYLANLAATYLEVNYETEPEFWMSAWLAERGVYVEMPEGDGSLTADEQALELIGPFWRTFTAPIYRSAHTGWTYPRASAKMR